MSYTNTTQYYNLPQYIASDKPTFLGDFNEAMRTIDSTMENNRVAAAEAGTGMSEAQQNLTTAQTDVGNAQTQLNALAAQVQKIENDSSEIATNASNAFANANQANQTAQTAVTTASQAVQTAQSANNTSANITVEINKLDARVTALENPKEEVIINKIGVGYYHPSGEGVTYFTKLYDKNLIGKKLTIKTSDSIALAKYGVDTTPNMNFPSNNILTIPSFNTYFAFGGNNSASTLQAVFEYELDNQ